jgi:adenosylmethionine---8-amino-7-oxononanoate aminotransferase
VTCMSKDITGGFLPMGVTAVTDEVFQAFVSTDRRRTFFHGHSYTANPIACAAARASLRLMDDDCTRRRGAIEDAHRAALARIATHPRVRDPRLIGTVAAFDLDTGAGYLSPVGRDLAEFAARDGVLLRPLGNVVYVMPPYCITPDELGRVYGTIERFLEGL